MRQFRPGGNVWRCLEIGWGSSHCQATFLGIKKLNEPADIPSENSFVQELEIMAPYIPLLELPWPLVTSVTKRTCRFQTTKHAAPLDHIRCLFGWVLGLYAKGTKEWFRLFADWPRMDAHRLCSLGFLPVWSSLRTSTRHFPFPVLSTSQYPATARLSPVQAT